MTIADLQQVPCLRRGFRFQWEPAQNCHVLLYPEGMIQLNESAALILQQVDGQRTLGEMITALRRQFPDAPDLAADVQQFMEVAHDNFWLEYR
ncbi:MAG: pyrroloquinoline quinone biosynthesis peptide chaperone PqqD [Gammaproteobacteria bacterium]|jgi:pyrroloquinoline quinone biosynthesis protein D|nr:pyrroloquinoline quinone biosynthesis peptide chaperone PqqD [Gammaproteobacteria bacterium]